MMNSSEIEPNNYQQDGYSLDAGAAENARRMADLFKFFANMLIHPPDADLIEELKEINRSSFPNNFFQLSGSNSFKTGIRDLSSFLTKLAENSDKDVELQLAVDWTLLFRGVGKGYGPPPPYEGVYLSQDKIGVETIQIVNRIYHEYGIGLAGDIQNRPDYLGFEFDFLRYLYEAEAESWQAGDQKDAVNFHMGAMKFFDEHIEPWVPKFIKEALPHAKTEFYRGFLSIVQGTVVDHKQLQDS